MDVHDKFNIEYNKGSVRESWKNAARRSSPLVVAGTSQDFRKFIIFTVAVSHRQVTQQLMNYERGMMIDVRYH